MSESVIWFVDLDASIVEANQLAQRVGTWLLAEGIVSPIPCQAPGRSHLLSRGESAAIWDSFPHSPLLLSGLEIVTERRVFHTGDNGIDGIRCPACGVKHRPDDLPWGDVVEAWFSGNAGDHMVCPDCNVSRSIVDWEFDSPWGFGNLAFGFWNWQISGRLANEIAAITGHRCRLVFEHV